jgi:hypothetical protein
MKHASPAALTPLAPLLAEIRLRPGLKEKKTGIFYHRSKSFLHFHEDPAGMFAGLLTTSGWERYEVNTAPQKQALLKALDLSLNGAAKMPLKP